ncbi:MAG: DUF1801 domain-containing protein [Flavobacteriales bacterium]
MGELKTKANDASVEDYINGIQDPKRKSDCVQVVQIMQDILGDPPIMWGKSIVGLGWYEMTYANGKKGEWMISGFSSRKQALTIYIMAGFTRYEEILKRLGKHKTGKSCLYIKTLDDIDLNVLKELIQASVKHLEKLRVYK